MRLPAGFSWAQRNGFIVIRNATHAMWDAMLLGRSLVGMLKVVLDKGVVRKATRMFEEEIFARAEGIA